MTFSIITANLQELQAGVTKLEAEAQHAEPDTGMAEFAIEARGNVVELQASMPDTQHPKHPKPEIWIVVVDHSHAHEPEP